MAISILSSELKSTPTGSITIPDYCTAIVALVKGSEDAPFINGTEMARACFTPAVGAIPAVSIHIMREPEIYTVTYYSTAQSIYFVYLRDAIGFNNASAGTAVSTKTIQMPTSTDEIIFGIIAGSNGVAMTGDAGAFTYLLNTTANKVGYKVPGDTNLTCVGTDANAVSGYYQAQPPVYHPSTLITAAWTEKVAVYHPAVPGGHYETGSIYHAGYWTSTVYTERYWTTVPYPHWVEATYLNTWTPPYYEYYNYWVDTTKPAYYTYNYVVHPAVYAKAYYTYPAAIWVATATPSRLNCAFCAISVDDRNDFVSCLTWL